MRIATLATAVIIASLTASPSAQAPRTAAPYFPDRHEWQPRKPEEAGMDAAKLEAAIKFAVASENPATKDLAVDLATTFGAREPFDAPIGPVKPRGALNGLIVRNGYVVAEWGDTERVDMTFSVTKTFLSTVVGLAWQKGLIRDVNDRVQPYVPLTDLLKMQSMTGGGHWGGGMFISARDMARFGYLFLRDGKWKERQIVSPKWIAMARTPGTAKTDYGYMNWMLNTDRRRYANAPATAVTFEGNGSNIIYVDRENDLVVVVRWIQGRAFNEFIGQVLASIQASR